MWKPGTRKPTATNRRRSKGSKISSTAVATHTSPTRPTRPHRQAHATTSNTDTRKETDHARRQDDEGPPPPVKGAKHLSGATLNMRFMQRHRESGRSLTTSKRSSAQAQHQPQPDQRLSSSSLEEITENEKATGKGFLSSPATAQSQYVEKHNEMAEETHDGIVEDVEMMDEQQQEQQASVFDVATAVDMYGSHQVTTIGRRSFGGFNLHIADCSSQQSAEGRGGELRHHRDKNNNNEHSNKHSNNSNSGTDRQYSPQRRKLKRGKSMGCNSPKRQKTRLSS